MFPGAAVLAAGAAAAVLARFATADADLSLLLRGHHKRDAFAGRVVWITGASQGLGEVLARYLASQGARLIISSRSREKLQAVKESCSGPHAAEALVLPFDLRGPQAALDEAAAAAAGAFGGAGVDYLVHVAGASQHALASETTRGVTEALLDLNALGPIALTRAVLPSMLAKKKGRIVVVASMSARVPSPGQAVYAAAKAAEWGFFASLATEVADQGVGVTVCCPGPIATGSAAAPRSIYGPEGPITRLEAPSKGRVTPERCARLVADAMGHGLSEVWIAKHPVLLLGYLMQYAPTLCMALMLKVGPARARAVSAGGNGYDMRAFLRSTTGSS